MWLWPHTVMADILMLFVVLNSPNRNNKKKHQGQNEKKRQHRHQTKGTGKTMNKEGQTTLWPKRINPDNTKLKR